MVAYADRKEAVRAVLKYCAMQRQTIRYGALGKAAGIPAQGPWKPLLDEISREETPDITFLVVNKYGLSSQIAFKDAIPATDKQKKQAAEMIEAVFSRYSVQK
ncbi:hypothetical protein LB531_03005 [Mesorhizobium sp. CO1-1-2]|uniref:hypothetical protein n=1 Tax=Mesorhizobium sp. CO1-1-2 TaxID=2876635 RepID=UPI001CCA0758|nr:hypothetical protein [Mesorhizobium sp. CO1-1-2]MBZ9679622.1 hypothetical protein [Mesorhizobium sp. CO1-1-2]